MCDRGDYLHRLRADAILRGELGMKFTARIHAPSYRPVRLRHRGKLPREATVVLQPARTLELRVRDEANRPTPAEYTVALAPAQPLEIRLYPAQTSPDDFGATPPVKDSESLGVRWAQVFSITSPTQEFTVENLAPSEAWLAALELYARGNSYSREKPFRILPQETRTVRMRYEPFNPNRYKGTRQITLRLMKRDGKPAANAPVRVQLYIPEYTQWVSVARARTDAQGRLRLQNLYELPEPPQDLRAAPRYYVYPAAEDAYEHIGEFSLVRGDGQQEILILERLREGDLAPDVELTDLRTGKTRRLSEFRGRYLLLDFWATWCMPCHRALEQLKARWDALDPAPREQVQVVLVSIDDDKAGVLEFLKQRGWDTLGELMWAGAGGWDSPAADAYNISSIPRQILLDPDGRVVVLKAREPLEALLGFMAETKREAGKSDASPN